MSETLLNRSPRPRRLRGDPGILDVIENAVQRVAAIDNPTRVRRDLRAAILLRDVVAVIPEAELDPGDRVRWGYPMWQAAAVETLLALGGGRCLAPGCGTHLRDGGRHYCWSHRALAPVRGENLPAATLRAYRRHDTAVDNIAKLLATVGERLGVPRL